MEIAQERLEREYDLSLITTAPSVIYRVYKTDGSMVEIDNPAELPAEGCLHCFPVPFYSPYLIIL